jgi:hypothetical protein
MPLNTPSSANRSMNPWTSRTSPSAKWYARRTSASVPVVIVISHLGIDQDVSRFPAGTVRGHYRIPVIVESCRPRNIGRPRPAHRPPRPHPRTRPHPPKPTGTSAPTSPSPADRYFCSATTPSAPSTPTPAAGPRSTNSPSQPCSPPSAQARQSPIKPPPAPPSPRTPRQTDHHHATPATRPRPAPQTAGRKGFKAELEDRRERMRRLGMCGWQPARLQSWSRPRAVRGDRRSGTVSPATTAVRPWRTTIRPSSARTARACRLTQRHQPATARNASRMSDPAAKITKAQM